jgi:molecular chaperone GrpE
VPKSFRVRIDDNDSHRKKGHSGEDVEQTAEEIAEIVAEDAGAADLQERIAELEAELDAARKAAEQEHDHYLRALADFSNFKRRRQEELESHIQFANQELILKLLPIIDNFERALQAAQEQHSFDSLAAGVELTLRQLKDMLQKEGVVPIDAVGQEFDPAIHEAVMSVESDEHPDNTVVEELQKGYMQKSRVIRPARVKVSVR